MPELFFCIKTSRMNDHTITVSIPLGSAGKDPDIDRSALWIEFIEHLPAGFRLRDLYTEEAITPRKMFTNQKLVIRSIFMAKPPKIFVEDNTIILVCSDYARTVTPEGVKKGFEGALEAIKTSNKSKEPYDNQFVYVRDKVNHVHYVAINNGNLMREMTISLPFKFRITNDPTEVQMQEIEKWCI